MLIAYALLMALISLRLMTYRRGGDSYRLLPTLLAYLMAVAAGSVPLRALLGSLPPPDASSVLLAAVVLVALCDAGGSTARLLPKRKGRARTNTAWDVYRRDLP